MFLTHRVVSCSSPPTTNTLTVLSQILYRAFFFKPSSTTFLFLFPFFYVHWSPRTNTTKKVCTCSFFLIFFLSLNVIFFIRHPSRQLCCNLKKKKKKVLLGKKSRRF